MREIFLREEPQQQGSLGLMALFEMFSGKRCVIGGMTQGTSAHPKGSWLVF